MDDPTFAAQADAWNKAMLLTTATCTAYYARRIPHWISISTRICGSLESSPLVRRSLAGELMYAARRELELRAEYTRRLIGELAEQGDGLPPAQVLVDCTRLAGELVQASVRDVMADIERSGRFLGGVDSGCVAGATSAALHRITDHLLALTSGRPDGVR